MCVVGTVQSPSANVRLIVTHEPPKFLFECVKHTETQPLKHGFKVTRIEDTKRTTFVVPESDVSSASDNGSDMVEDQGRSSTPLLCM